MKLLFCSDCHDVFSLRVNIEKTCHCGKVKGMYLDDLNAVHTGGVPLGFANSSLVEALKNQPEKGDGARFTAFVIPKECETFNET